MNKESDVWNKHGAVGVIPAAEKNIWRFVVYQLFNVNKRQLYFLDWLIDSWLLHRRINPPLPPKPSIYPSCCLVIWRFADIAEQISSDIASVCSSSTNPAIAKMPQRNSFLLGSLAWFLMNCSMLNGEIHLEIMDSHVLPTSPGGDAVADEADLGEGDEAWCLSFGTHDTWRFLF